MMKRQDRVWVSSVDRQVDYISKHMYREGIDVEGLHTLLGEMLGWQSVFGFYVLLIHLRYYTIGVGPRIEVALPCLNPPGRAGCA